MYMQQLLWIGCMENDEELKNKVAKGYTLASAILSQRNIFSGIEKITGGFFDSINGSVTLPYPLYKDKFITPVEWDEENGSHHISVGYANIKYLNRYLCKQAMLSAADEWVEKRYKGGELIVFAYSMRSAPMATACRIKEKIPNAKIYLIVTDLPEFMDLGQNKLKSFLKKVDGVSIKRMRKNFDGFVLYAAKMAEYMGIPDDKWMLMEGSYNLDDSKIKREGDLKGKIIMYSGALGLQYGIGLLIEAFMQIEDKDSQLWFTGGGSCVDYIKESAKKDSRIKYFGFLPSREDVLVLQKNATAFINMRLPSAPASSYCFPSKLFEYMTSGKPVLSFKLEGMPEEYMDYLIPIEEESTEAIKEAILNVFSMSSQEKEEIAKNAYSFIKKYKSLEFQAKRICEFCGLKGDNL